MTIRRLAQSPRDQNWSTIGVEFVLLVGGVFLGIQAANWNQARTDERRGRDYARRLAADLAQDLASRRALVACFGAVLAAIERALAAVAARPAEATR